MKKIIIVISFSLILINFSACDKDSSSPTGPNVVATEIWEFIMDNDSSHYGEANFKKMADENISIDGTWYFPYGDTIVTCTFQSNSVIKTDSSFSASLNGTASNPGAPEGYRTSNFTINMNGTLYNGQSNGVYLLNFSTFGWPKNVSGTYIATRKSGSGVT